MRPFESPTREPLQWLGKGGYSSGSVKGATRVARMRATTESTSAEITVRDHNTEEVAEASYAACGCSGCSRCPTADRERGREPAGMMDGTLCARVPHCGRGGAGVGWGSRVTRRLAGQPRRYAGGPPASHSRIPEPRAGGRAATRGRTARGAALLPREV